MRNVIRTGARGPVTGSRAYRAGDITRSNAGGNRGGIAGGSRGAQGTGRT